MFLVNLPIIAVALVAGWVLVPKSKDATASPLDPVGALLSIVGLERARLRHHRGPAPRLDERSASLLWFGGAGDRAAWRSASGSWRNRHPMLDLRLFQNPRFAVSSGGITLVFFAMFGTFFLLAQYLQGVLDYSPLGAAVRLLPISVVMMAVAPQTPKLVARFGADKIGMAGLLLRRRRPRRHRPLPGRTRRYLQLVVTMCVLAAGMALTMTPMTTQLMAAVPRDRAGMGSATNDTTRELGGALGVAVLGSLLASQYTSGVSDGRRRPARRGPRGRRGQPRRRPRPRRPGRRAGRRASSTWPRRPSSTGSRWRPPSAP